MLSWNVQGLGAPQCKCMRGRLRLELHKAVIGTPIDILFIQEHHLCKRRIDKYGSILPGQLTSFWSPSIGRQGAEAGVCLSVAEKWETCVVHYEEVIPGTTQYVIYAPNGNSERKTFWDQLITLLPPIENWCIGGDFNILERIVIEWVVVG